MGRGQKLFAPFEADKYQCSVCGFETATYHSCDRHIITQHYGQALMNEKRELSDSEKLAAYIRAAKSLKILKCKICDKGFKTGLGLKMHLDICGKSESEIYRDCEVCGKRLKIHSVSAHMKLHLNDDDDFEEIPVEPLKPHSGGKRNSALKALSSFKELNEEENEARPKKKKTNDDEFKVDGEEESDGDDEMEDELEEEEDLVSENGDIDNNDGLESSLDLQGSVCGVVSAEKMDKIVVSMKSYIKRVGTADEVKPDLQDLDENLDLLPCYNPKCGRAFKYRISLENHYRKCCNRRFLFSCSINNCHFKSVKLNETFIRHFYIRHSNLFPDCDSDFFALCFGNRDQRKQVKYLSPKIFRSHKEMHKKLIEFYTTHSSTFTYSCLKSTASNWKTVSRPSSEFKGRDILFKSTKSMESGDNQVKLVSPLQVFRLDDGCTVINVGQSVSAVAWCPLPIKLESARQYLAIATTSYENLLNNISSGKNYLQIWDFGNLSESGSPTEAARLAINIVQTNGDILDLAWCPCGTSYEAVEPKSKKNRFLSRLGLLAVASEDGRIRLFSIPHPQQLSNAYKINVLFKTDPVLILEHRYHVMICNTVSWHWNWPQDKIIAGFNDGDICYWKLTNIAKCTGIGDLVCDACHEERILKPMKIFHNFKKNPILSVQWVNSWMFFAASLDNCRLWNIFYTDPHAELNRCTFQKVETHPLWFDMVSLSELQLSKANTSVGLLNHYSEEFENRLALFYNANKIKIHDTSISPWMYVIAFCTENGEVYTTEMLPRPGSGSKKQSFKALLYNIRLARNVVEEEPTNKKSKKSSTTTTKTKQVLINETVDVDCQNFWQEYCLIFEEQEKVNLNRRSLFNSGIISTSPLSKGDLYKLYSITNCCWNPNYCSSSWLFTATKSGLCRVNNYRLDQVPT